MRASPIGLLSLPLLFLFAPPAAAQDQPMSFEGNLQQCANRHEVRLEGGRRYVVTAASAEFDTIVAVYRAGQAEELARDDDGGDGTNSRLDFVPGESGDYVVCVSAFSGGGAGPYSVNVTPSAPLPPAVSRPTRTERARWQVFEGTLSAGDLEEGGRRFDDYEISLRDGERALIALDTGDFDPVLNVYPAGQRGGSSAMSDDDGGGNLNAFMVLAPERGGTFIVRVTAFSEESDGAYKLRVATERVPEREEATAAEAMDAAAEAAEAAAEAAEEHAH